MKDKRSKPSSGNLWIKDELRKAALEGIPTTVNGIPYDSTESSNIPFFCENGTYMEDFINDENGRIIQINFEQIRHYR